MFLVCSANVLHYAYNHSIYMTIFSIYSCKIFTFLTQQIALLDFYTMVKRVSSALFLHKTRQDLFGLF